MAVAGLREEVVRSEGWVWEVEIDVRLKRQGMYIQEEMSKVLKGMECLRR